MAISAIDTDRLSYDESVGGWVHELGVAWSHTQTAAVAVDYTKGDETDLALALGYRLSDDERVYRLTERDYDDEAQDVVIKLTADGERLIPVPLPSSAAALILFPTLTDAGAGEGSAVLDVRHW